MGVEGSFLSWDELLRFSTVAGVVWTAVWFLSNKFDTLKNLFLDKLEYHERHDDQRFDNMRKDIIALRIALARSSKSMDKYIEENGNTNGNPIRN